MTWHAFTSLIYIYIYICMCVCVCVCVFVCVNLNDILHVLCHVSKFRFWDVYLIYAWAFYRSNSLARVTRKQTPIRLIFFSSILLLLLSSSEFWFMSVVSFDRMFVEDKSSRRQQNSRNLRFIINVSFLVLFCFFKFNSFFSWRKRWQHIRA